MDDQPRLEETAFDVILLGTGLAESILAGACARLGKKVLHLDANDYYGGTWATFNYTNFGVWARNGFPGPLVSAAVDPIPEGCELLQLNGEDIAAHPAFVDVSIDVTNNGPAPPAPAAPAPVAPPAPPAADATITEAAAEGGEQAETTAEPLAPAPVPAPAPAPVTYDAEFTRLSRRFNIDLSPQLVFSRGALVDALVASGVSKYLEFKCLEQALLYYEGAPRVVPCSKGDIFSSTYVKPLEKRSLMKVLKICLGEEAGDGTDPDAPGILAEWGDRPFMEFLQSQKLNDKLQAFVLYAIALQNSGDPASMSTREGVLAMRAYLAALGRYGKTAFLTPLYGTSEIGQAFCRHCAVHGGMYILQRTARAFVMGNDNRIRGIVCTAGQYLSTNFLVAAPDYVPMFLSGEATRVSRAVAISDRPLVEGTSLLVMSIPPGRFRHPHAIAVTQTNESTDTCPAGYYLIHFSTLGRDSAREDLEDAVRHIIPNVCWAAFFTRRIRAAKDAAQIPPNVLVAPDAEHAVHMEGAVAAARVMFERMYPGEEFLEALPPPEDYEDEPAPEADAPPAPAGDAAAPMPADLPAPEPGEALP